MKKILVFLLLCCPSIFFSQNLSDSLATASSFENTSTTSLFDLFSNIASTQKDNILNITLYTDIDSLVTSKKSLQGFIPSNVSFLNENNDTISLKSSIRIRGKFRRMTCDFPPLRIKIKKKKLRKLGLNDEYNSFKLVTHCLDDKEKSNENLLREYLLYKIYNLHSDYSLRAQLVKITYVQSDTNKKKYERFGVLLEDDEELATRSKAVVVESYGCSMDSLDVFGSSVHAMFQCMIGNADWGIMGLRNAKVMRLHNQNLLTIFPYDFDFSGFVDAGYAIPNPDYNLSSVQQRVFLGKIHSDETMHSVAKHFLDRKEETLELCKNFTLLSKRCRKKSIKYLKSFYKKIENEKEFLIELQKLCPKN